MFPGLFGRCLTRVFDHPARRATLIVEPPAAELPARWASRQRPPTRAEAEGRSNRQHSGGNPGAILNLFALLLGFSVSQAADGFSDRVKLSAEEAIGTQTAPRLLPAGGCASETGNAYARSYRSRFITLVQAATKSATNFFSPSVQP